MENRRFWPAVEYPLVEISTHCVRGTKERYEARSKLTRLMAHSRSPLWERCRKRARTFSELRRDVDVLQRRCRSRPAVGPSLFRTVICLVSLLLEAQAKQLVSHLASGQTGWRRARPTKEQRPEGLQQSDTSLRGAFSRYSSGWSLGWPATWVDGLAGWQVG